MFKKNKHFVFLIIFFLISSIFLITAKVLIIKADPAATSYGSYSGTSVMIDSIAPRLGIPCQIVINSSGVGSYGIFADYKAQFINSFIDNNQILTMCELGCGDGNQLALFRPIEYYGYDISPVVIRENIKKYSGNNYFFSTDINDFLARKYDLTLSLDVIYHLIEDDVFEEYMINLFKLSYKFVIIYSPNEDKNFGNHVKYRNFMKNISDDFELVSQFDNPLKGSETQSDFFLFKKKQ
jgi:SAM-dependent methyltransferase